MDFDLVNTPPPISFNAPLAHKICEFYKKVYLLSKKIAKRDRYGIYSKIENISLEALTLVLQAALEIKPNKLSILNNARIKIEILKRLFRITNELKIIQDKAYFKIEADLQEMSKMTNGWIKYLKIENTA